MVMIKSVVGRPDSHGRDYKTKHNDTQKLDLANRGLLMIWRRRLIVAILLSIPTIACLVCRLFSAFNEYIYFIELIVASLTILIILPAFIRSTRLGLRQHIINSDSLVVVGSFTAWLFSFISYITFAIDQHTWLIATDQLQLYFTTAVLLVAIATIGKWIEAHATVKSMISTRQLIDLRPKTAHLVQSHHTIDILASEVKIGDTLLVRSGETIPVDGIILSGQSLINESMITGESIAPLKKAGDSVISGTLNGAGELKIIARRIGDATILSRIIQLVSQAQKLRTPIQDVADRVANVFVPLAMLGCLTATSIKYFLWGADLADTAQTFILSISIATPLAFGIAVPTSVSAGISTARRAGILVKNSQALYMLSLIDTVVFDKTGTLTIGQTEVSSFRTFSMGRKEALRIAASLSAISDQTSARAIVSLAKGRDIQLSAVTDFRNEDHVNLSGKIDGKLYYIGTADFVLENSTDNLPRPAKLHRPNGRSALYLFTKSKVLARFNLSDPAKATARQAVRELKELGIEPILLSGDAPSVARTLARQVGIKHVIADVMPDNKASEILNLRKKGHWVAMLGDGINDTPALASANIGVSIGSGAEAAIETSDIVLATSDPVDLCRAIRIGRATTNTSKHNLVAALLFNVISVPIAIGGLSWIGITLANYNLVMAIIGLSTLAVLANSITLRFTNFSKSSTAISSLSSLIILTIFTIIYLKFGISYL